MSTIRKWLDYMGFDWPSGIIVIQPVSEESYSPGWGEPVDAFFAAMDCPVLDEEFDNGYGTPRCPRFVAKDKRAIYFPTQYDGATSCEKIYTDMRKYLDWETNKSPYPGG